MANYMTPLPGRGVLEIKGADKSTFLQGIMTNDIYSLSPENALYTALLTPQGRYLYDFFIVEIGDSYYLDGEASRLEDVIKKLSLYKLRADVTFILRSDLPVYAYWGEGVSSLLNLDNKHGASHNTFYMDPRLAALGARSFGKAEVEGFQLKSPEDYDQHRLSLGIPEGGRDLIPDKSIPLESGLDELHAISWTKGCFMGQELTARTKYQGLVRKRLIPVVFEGKPPPFGTGVFLEGDPVGEVRTTSGSQGLIMVRLEALKSHLEEHGKLMAGEANLTPHVPSWMKLTSS